MKGKGEAITFNLAQIRLRIIEALTPCFSGSSTESLKAAADDVWAWLLAGTVDADKLIDERAKAEHQAKTWAVAFYIVLIIVMGLLYPFIRGLFV